MAVDDVAERLGIGDLPRVWNRHPLPLQGARRQCPGAQSHDQFDEEDKPYQRADRQILEKALLNFRKADVEHHDDEEEKDRHCPHVDHDQDHGQELRPHQQEQPSGIEKGQDQEKNRVNRIARRNNHHGRRHDDCSEEIEDEAVNDHGAAHLLTTGGLNPFISYSLLSAAPGIGSKRPQR